MSGASLNVPESRAILIADDALENSYEARLESGQILGLEEGDAWRALVARAHARIAEYEGTKLPVIGSSPTPYPGGNEPDFQTLFIEALAGKKSEAP